MRLVDRVIVDQLQRELRHNPEASAGGNQPRPHLRVGRARERVDLRCGRLTPFRRNFVYLYGEPLTPYTKHHRAELREVGWLEEERGVAAVRPVLYYWDVATDL